MILTTSIERSFLNTEKIVNNDGTESFVPNQNIFLAALIAIAVLAIFLLIFERRKES